MTELETLWRHHVQAVAEAEKSRAKVHAGIAKALREGARPSEIVRLTGLTSEAVRLIARKQGLPPLRKQRGVRDRRAESPGT